MDNILIRSGIWAKMRRRRMIPSFSSSSSDDVITITVMDAVPADDSGAPAKDGS